MHSIMQENNGILQLDLMLGQAQHEIQRLVLIPAHRVSVEVEKDEGGKNSRALVAIDKRMVQDERVKQRGCLCGQVRVSIRTKGAGLWPGDSRFQESPVSQQVPSAHH